MVDATTLGIYMSAGIGIIFASYQLYLNSKTKVELFDEPQIEASEGVPLFARGHTRTRNLVEIYESIAEGAEAFLHEEYKICLIFMITAFIVRSHNIFN